MVEIVHEVFIEARQNAPETTLFVKIIKGYDKHNHKKPYLFMLPGGPGFNHTHYQDYAGLSDVAHIVFHDPRGCGLSRKWSENDAPETFNMDNYIQDVEAIRNYLKLERIIVLGKSYGAMCALGYTLRYPEAVLQLILAAGSPSYKNLDTAKENIKLQGSEEQNKICEKLWAGTFENDEDVKQYMDVMKPLYSWKIAHDEKVNRPMPLPILPVAHRVINQGFGHFLREFNYESDLSKIETDVLILVGEEDWITDKKHSEFMAKHIVNARLMMFEKANHSMESDVPMSFFAEIRKFVITLKQNKQPNFFELTDHENKKKEDEFRKPITLS